MRNLPTIFLNGRRVRVSEDDPLLKQRSSCLLDLVRKQGAHGPKQGCGEGGCGSCTVVLSWMDLANHVHFQPVYACATPIIWADGCNVITAEGIAASSAKWTELLVSLSATQCGFCTPGMVSSLGAGLAWEEKDLEEALVGNLCRCTGYRPLLDVAAVLGTSGKKWNSLEREEEEDIFVSTLEDKIREKTLGVLENPLPTPTHVLKTLLKECKSELRIGCETGTWFKPTKVLDLLRLASLYQSPSLVCAAPWSFVAWPTPSDAPKIPDEEPGTDLPPRMVVSMSSGPARVVLNGVQELSTCSVTLEGEVRFGSGCSLRNASLFLKDAEISSELKSMLRSAMVKVGTPQTVASTAIGWAAWICSGGGDGEQWVEETEAEIVQAQIEQPRILEIGDLLCANEGVGPLPIDPRELPLEVIVPRGEEGGVYRAYAGRPRRGHAAAVVAAAFRVVVGEKGQVSRVCCAVAGVASGIMRLKWVEKHLGELENVQAWANSSHMSTLLTSALTKDLEHGFALPRARPDRHRHRKALAAAFVRRFVADVCRLHAVGDQDLLDAATVAEDPPRKASQRWPVVDTNPLQPVGEAVENVDAPQHIAGSARYIVDILPPQGTLHAAIVRSSIAHAKIETVEVDHVLQRDGVFGYFDHSDTAPQAEVPVGCERVFAEGEVTCVGQAIGIIVADSPEVARMAAADVRVHYTPLPAVVSLEEAIRKKSFWPHRSGVVADEDVEEALKGKDIIRVIQGQVRSGGQEHFYLEPHCLLVEPEAGGGITVRTCTQCVHKTQRVVAGTLGIPQSKVTVEVSRVGGAFGGKEVEATLTAGRLSVPARRLERPVRIEFSRREDMLTTGGRHPFLGVYRVGVARNDDGSVRIAVLDLDLYADAGHTEAISGPVLDRAVLHATNAYRIDKVYVRGILCKTNLPSSTAFRGFGGPQAMFVMQTILDHVALEMKVDSIDLQRSHLLKDGDRMPYGVYLPRCPLRAMYERFCNQVHLEERKQSVHVFNKRHRWRKRGLAMVPVMYGIAFPLAALNQGGALVHVHTDGSVFVGHGGVDMGQGLNTKCAQVAAHALGVPLKDVRVGPCSSALVPNASPTAASMGSDLYCAAVLDACKQIKARLTKIEEELAGASQEPVPFSKVAGTAWFRRIHLSAAGFHATKVGGHYNWREWEKGGNTERGEPFGYYTYGMGCCEVELDVLTGAHVCARVDIELDAGRSINPLVDIGQTEGGFMQGLGMFTCEEVLWGDEKHQWAPEGHLITSGVHSYHLPTSADVPREFHVRLTPGSGNDHAVYSSKATGEPPLFLAACVFFALKNAIASARADAGLGEEHFRLDVPLTRERVLASCMREKGGGHGPGGEEGGLRG